MIYMRGWSLGARGASWNPSDMKNPDFKQGHEDGRVARESAYDLACDRLGAKPSSLREGAKEDAG